MAPIAILGAGIVGTAAAWDMNRRGHEVVVAAVSAATAETAARIANATARQLDATNDEELRALLESIDLVVSSAHTASVSSSLPQR